MLRKIEGEIFLVFAISAILFAPSLVFDWGPYGLKSMRLPLKKT